MSQPLYSPSRPQQQPFFSQSQCPPRVPMSNPYVPYGVYAGQQPQVHYVPMQHPQEPSQAASLNAAQMLQSNPTLRAEFYDFLKQKMQAYQSGQIRGECSWGVVPYWVLHVPVLF
jgi:hypothetical protein